MVLFKVPKFHSLSSRNKTTRTAKMAAQEKNTQEIEKASRLAHVPNGDEYEKMISGML